MLGRHSASSALPLLLLLTGASLLHAAPPIPRHDPEEAGGSVNAAPPAAAAAGEERRMSKRIETEEEEEEEEEELFKDVDPKRLAAVLLEALNRSDAGRRREEEWGEEQEGNREVRTMEGADRDRNGRQEIEMLMAVQGKEREEEEEQRRRAEEEEEKMTEKVRSRTTSQTVQVQAAAHGGGGGGEGGENQEVNAPHKNEAQQEEEEEQLSPEELKSLETMMKEFPRLNTATKREEEEETQRESRGWSSYNEVIPLKANAGAKTKEKLRWQEETQKGVNFPLFRGGSFMDELQEENQAAGNQIPGREEAKEEAQDPEEEEEEALSPEEEEARAKAEQEELRRQAEEARRAKMEEEKLADIASDMLLRYMGKQNAGNRKYAANRKYSSSSLSNAAEDKRSDEEEEAAEEEEEDIDPQTIDKLIEISNKLHLPADDVVDIISDVEKKKKKDLPPDSPARWQRPLTPPSSSKALSPSPANQNSFPVSKQPSPVTNLLKTWFTQNTDPWGEPQNLWPQPPRPKQEVWTQPPRPKQEVWSPPPRPKQEVWSEPPRLKQEVWSEPPRLKQEVWSQPPRPKQEVWFKSPKPLRFKYPSYYPRKSFPNYYTIYSAPPPRPQPRYFLSKPALDAAYAFLPKRRYHSWIQPRLRTASPGIQRKPYYPPSYPLPLRPRTFPPQLYFPALTRNRAGKAVENGDLEKFIQQVLRTRSQKSD